MSSYAVLHIEKGGKSAKGIGQHCDRSKEVSNADPEKSHLNFKLVLEGTKYSWMKLGEGKALEDLVEERIRTGYKGHKAIRKDAVKHLSIVLTGSHEHMKEIENDKEKRNQWISKNYEFICKTFGGQKNVVGFYLHRDEKTMHIHAQVVPVTPDGRLSSVDYIGGHEKLRKIQSDYAKDMQDVDLKFVRGVEGSKAKHTDVGWFYGKVKEMQNNSGIDFSKFRFEPTLSAVEKPEPNLLGYYTQKDLERLERAKNGQIEEIKKRAQKDIDEISRVAQKSEHQMRVMKFQKTTDELRERQIKIGVRPDQSKGRSM